MAQSIREYHHGALWEEEKHFTWLLGILLTVMVAVFAARELDVITKAAIIMSLAVLGVVFSAFALRVIRRESQYFHDANRRFMSAHRGCYPDIELPVLSRSANLSLVRLILFGLTFRAGVRDIFQLVFVVFGFAFVVAAILAASLFVAE